MSEALDEPPLLGRVVEDEYGPRYGLSWLIGGIIMSLIISKLELERPMGQSLPPLLGMVVEDEYGLSWLTEGIIVSKLELEPPMGESLPRKVDRDALRRPSFEGCPYGERRGFSFLMGGIMSATPIFGSSY